jgi:hypothetical protein
MRTFFDSDNDYTPKPLLPNTFPNQTNPQSVMPYYSPKVEPFWGHKQAEKFIVEGVEDDYVPGLIRNPVINVREFSVQGLADPNELDPTQQPFFGYNVKNLRIWYIATPYSHAGKCSDNATMRIYFAYGTADNNQNADNECYVSTHNFLKRIRVGDTIQIRNTASLFGEKAEAYNHTNYTNGNNVFVGGSNVFVCRGYRAWGEGYTTADGDEVDNFEQVGSTAQNRYRQEDVYSALGEIMRVVQVNIGTFNRDIRAGGLPEYKPNMIGGGLDTLKNFLPFIEVQAPRGVSLAWGNPNMSNTRATNGYGTLTDPQPLSGIPWQGPWVAGQTAPRNNHTAQKYMSPPLSLAIRTWTAHNRTPQVKLNSIPVNADKPTSFPHETKVICSNPFPTEDMTDPTNPELNEKLYLTFRPYYFAPADTGNDPTDIMNSSYFMRHVEERFSELTGDRDGYLAQSGLTGPQVIINHNYNFDTLGTDGNDSKVLKFGHDLTLDSANNYAGGRLPEFFKTPNTSNMFTSDKYTTTTRIGVHNQGEDYYCREDYNSWADVGYLNPVYNQTTNPNAGNSDNSWLCENNINRNSQSLNPNSGLYTLNTDGMPTRFYFTCPIDNTTPKYTGQSGIQAWDRNANNRGADMISGMKNYIIGAKNLPTAKYSEFMISDGQGGFVRNMVDAGGLWYGIKFMDNPPYAQDNGNTRFNQAVYNNIGYYSDIMDYRLVMSQYPNETYARFVNTVTGESEVMFIKIMPQKVRCCVRADQKDITKLNAGTISFETLNPVLEEDNADPNTPYNARASFAPAFFILRRDCEGTGMVAFTGNDDSNGADVGKFNTMLWATDNPATQKRGVDATKSYFEILNGWAQIEHQIRIDNHTKDLLPIGFDDATDNIDYDENFGIMTPNRYGNTCGGDFYLTKYPNMPYVEDATNILRTTDSMIRLSKSLIKTGSPTRSGLNLIDFADQSNMGNLVYDIHYDFVDLDLSGDKNYYSPNDIANLITEQLHKPKDLYKSWNAELQKGGGNYEGGTFPNSAGKYPVNALFRPIHGPSDSGTSGDGNIWDINNTGTYKGKLREGDFCFRLDIQQENIHNAINAFGSYGGQLRGDAVDEDPERDKTLYEMPQSGSYEVLIPNTNTKQRTFAGTNYYRLSGFGQSEDVSQNIVRSFFCPGHTYPTERPANGWHQKYDKTETFGSMFIGTNNAQLLYNTDVSRFEWKFFHPYLFYHYSYHLYSYEYRVFHYLLHLLSLLLVILIVLAVIGLLFFLLFVHFYLTLRS